MKLIFALTWFLCMVGTITMIFGYIWIEEQQWYMDKMFATFIAGFFISLFLFHIWPDDKKPNHSS